MRRAQAGIELALVIAIGFVALGFIVTNMDKSVGSVQEDRAKKSMETLADAVKQVELGGDGAIETVELFVPDNVDPASTYVANGVINLGLKLEGGATHDISVPLDGCLVGKLPTTPGTHTITVKGGECSSLTSGKFEINPTYISVWLQPGEETTATLNIIVEEPQQVLLKADPAMTDFIDLDPSPGMQATYLAVAPGTSVVRLTAPTSAPLGQQAGFVTVESSYGMRKVLVEVNVYSSTLQLQTFSNSARTRENDRFYITDRLYFRNFYQRNNQLSTTDLNYTFISPYGTVAGSGTGRAYNGIFDGNVSGTSLGRYNLTVVDMDTGVRTSKIVQAVKQVGWKVEFQSEQTPVFYSNQTSAVMSFQVLDQAGNPVNNLNFVDSRVLFPMSAADWKMFQASCSGDPCTPAACPLQPQLNNWYQDGFDDSTWDNTTLPSLWYNNTGNWNCTGCTRIFRKQFTLTQDDIQRLNGLSIQYQCDEGCECYINGMNVFSPTTCQTSFPVPILNGSRIDPGFLNGLRVGNNLIACRVVEKKSSQTDFRHFDAGVSLVFNHNGDVSLKKMLSSAPSLNSYMTIANAGDWYQVSFNPQELSVLPSTKGSNGTYVLDVTANVTGVQVERGVTFNIQTPPTPGNAYILRFVQPTDVNVDESKNLNIFVEVIGQNQAQINNQRVVIRVRDANTDAQLQQCILNTANSGNLYNCTITADKIAENSTYRIWVQDSAVQPQGLMLVQSFNGVKGGN